MTYAGAAQAAESRALLGTALEALQKDPNIPKDVLAIAENIAGAVGALFEAEKATSDLDGKASVKHAMGSLSQTMALLQDVKTNHEGIVGATQALARVMSKLYPLAQVPTLRPSAGPSQAPLRGPVVAPVVAPVVGIENAKTVVAAAPLPREVVAAAPAKPAAQSPQSPKETGGASKKKAAEPVAVAKPAAAKPVATGPRHKLEANVGATTESNFFVGFSGEIAEGGVFIATYATFAVGSLVEVLVTLPGNFQFNVQGVVRFVRDPMDMDSEPGIGVRFDHLSNEHRELILRFVRKRPPLFYDE
jgi:uncharacterized protein (TIGR02266 family)